MNLVISQAYLDFQPNLVNINNEVISHLSFSLENKNLFKNYIDNFYTKNSLHENITFILMFNSINYQFWDLIDSQFMRYSNNGDIGAVAAFNSFINFYNYLKHKSFNSNEINIHNIELFFGNIPNINSRIKIFKESINITVIQECISSIENYIFNKQLIDTSLAFEISQKFPESYSEPYLKKIQLALYEIGKLYEYYYLKPIKYDITVAADYQIPKVLYGINVLEYSTDLIYIIDNHLLIEENSAIEKAIRSATILACDQISKIHNIDIPTLDKLLWLQRNKFSHLNFHLTKTTKY